MVIADNSPTGAENEDRARIAIEGKRQYKGRDRRATTKKKSIEGIEPRAKKIFDIALLVYQLSQLHVHDLKSLRNNYNNVPTHQ